LLLQRHRMARQVGATGIYVLTGHGSRHLAELPSGVPVANGIADAVRTILAMYAKASGPSN
jgi:hypothetical protein